MLSLCVTKEQLSMNSKAIEFNFNVKSEMYSIPSVNRLLTLQKWHFEVLLKVIYESQRI